LIMAKNADIAVRVGADIQPLQTGMDQAGESMRKFGRVSMNVTKAVAGAALAAAAAGAALLKTSSEMAKEITNLSRVAGTSTTKFQKMSSAARTVGVEQDKLADIFKDVSDKIGDFMQTGAGPMADFFENIAPKVGVTAQEFKDLSGPDALQLYVSSLEKANLTQAEMTFYMEAVASDATLLLPLMQNNGKAMKEFGDEALKTGRVLSTLELKTLEQASVVMQNLEESSKATSARIAVQLAPALNMIADNMYRVNDVLSGFHVIIKGVEAAFWGLSVVVNTVLAEIGKFTDAMFQDILSGLNIMIRGFNKLPGVDIAEIVYGNDLSNSLQASADIAKQHLATTLQEMHQIAMQEAPSIGDGVFGLPDMPTETDPVTKAKDEAAAIEQVQIDHLAAMQSRQAMWVQAQMNIAQAGHDKELALAAAKAANREAIEDHLQTAIGGLMQSGNKKMFKIGKAAAIASATVDGITAAVSSYKAGAKIGGPVLGASFAGASLLATDAQINQLKSQSFSGGSQGSAPSVTEPSVSSGAGAGAGQSQNVSNISVSLQGDTFGRGTITGLIDQINEAIDDGATLNSVSIV
jgi:hypothetical protein